MGVHVHICEMRLRNFRNFQRARFRFEKGVNTLIGENGSGKTNALHALRLLLDDSLSRRALRLSDTDFCRALGAWQGHWVVLSIDFDELDPSEGCQLLRQEAGHMDGTNRGTHSLYFRPRLEVRKKLYEMSTDGTSIEVRRAYVEGITTDQYEAMLTGRAQGDFLDDAVYSSVVGDFDTMVFPNPETDDLAAVGVSMRPIVDEISCTFAPALRDVVSDLRGYRSNPLLGLLRGTESNIQIDDAERIEKAVEDLNKDISSLPEIKEIAAAIQTTLHSAVGRTYSPLVDIESGLPEKMERLLQRLNMKVGDGDQSDFRGELSEQSLGGANLIYLALKLLEYEMKLSGDRVAHFLLIEEPEAHIHTHIQKTLFEKQSSKTQVIVSTHSTHISSAARIRSVNVLARRRDCAEVYQPSRDLAEASISRVERYLDSMRSTLLFAKGVILVEGSAEQILLPNLVKAVFGLSPDELGISIISMDSSFFGHVAVIFDEVRIKRRCAIVTDLDAPFIDLPEEPDDDTPEQKHARAAEVAGAQRHQSLEAQTKTNPWVSAFFAEHTFEVDFISAGNAHEVCQVLPDIYKKQSNIDIVKGRLEHESIAVYGREVLRLADNVGKGWFSLLLSEHVFSRTFMPDYILRAVTFAATDSLNPEVLKRIGLYRIEAGALNEESEKQLPELDAMRDLEPADFLKVYKEAANTDELSRVLELLGGS